jgi:predicted transport protein
MSAGYVYILFNPGLRENYLKIGLTTRTPAERARELSSATGVPKPFEVAYSIRVGDCLACERFVHQRLGQYRAGKEFFEISLEDAQRVVDEAATRVGIDASPDPMVVAPEQLGEISFYAPKVARPPVPFESHLPKTDLLGREILLQLREKMLSLGDDVVETATKGNRVAYSRGRVFVEVKVHKHRVRVLFLDIELNDPLGVVETVPETHGWGRLKYLMNLRSLDDLKYVLPYLASSYTHAAVLRGSKILKRLA